MHCLTAEPALPCAGLESGCGMAVRAMAALQKCMCSWYSACDDGVTPVAQGRGGALSDVRRLHMQGLSTVMWAALGMGAGQQG